MNISRIDWKRKLTAFAVFTAGLSFLFGLSHAPLKIAVVSQPELKWGSGGATIDASPDLDHGFGSFSNEYHHLVADGSGNNIVFMEMSDGATSWWSAQKINASGENQWGLDGIPVGAHIGSTSYFSSISDGAGGAFAVWDDDSGYAYAQRVLSNGSLGAVTPITLAGAGACVPDRADFGNQYGTVNLVTDGAGGFIAVWRLLNSGTGAGYCAQRVDSDLNLLWNANGIQISSGSTPDKISIVEDGSSGFFAYWYEGSATVTTHYDSTGAVVAGCPVAGGEITRADSPILVSDGAGGMVIIYRNASYSYSAKHFSSTCVKDPAWPADGVVVGPAWRVPTNAFLVPGVSGILVSVNGTSSSPTADLISLADGTSLWGGYKAVVTGFSNSSSNAAFAIASGTDFMFVVDKGATGPYAMKLTGATGLADPAWPAAGVSLGLLGGSPIGAVADGAGGMVVISQKAGIYGHRINSSGTLLWSANTRLFDESFITNTYVYGLRSVASTDERTGVFWLRSNNSIGESYKQLKFQLYDSGQAMGSVVEVTPLTKWDGEEPHIWDAFADTSGFYVLWSSDDAYLYIQKISLNGEVLWTEGGVEAFDSEVVYDVGVHSMTSDNANGAIIACSLDWEVSVQRIDSSGARLWGDEGIELGELDDEPLLIASDNNNGAYVSWYQGNDVYLSRVNSAGATYPGFADPGLVIAGTGASEQVKSLVADGQGNAIITYRYDNKYQYAQKRDGTGVSLWESAVPAVTINSTQTTQNIRYGGYTVSDGNGGVIMSWSDNRNGSGDIYAQRLNARGIPQWGTVKATNLTTSLAGGEATVAVGSTAGFTSSGMVRIGSSLVTYTGKTVTQLTGCSNTPVALNGSAVIQDVGIMVGATNSASTAYDVIPDGNGGAIFSYYNPSLAGTYISVVTSSGLLSYGGEQLADSVSASGGEHRSARSGQGHLMIWAPGDDVRGQYIVIPISSPAAGAPSVSPASGASPDGGEAVVPGIENVTYYFTNPGNATSFNLYEVADDGSRILKATIDDPIATSIVESNLSPNTEYGNRVVVGVNDRGESADSPIYPIFATLQNLTESVLATDNKDTTVTIIALGDYHNLTTEQSGINFTVVDTTETSDWIQTTSWTATGLEVGETYTIEVQTRNQDGVVGAVQSFDVIPTPKPEPKIKLTKTAEVVPPVFNAASQIQLKPTVRYTITAANIGSAIAYNVNIMDIIPSALVFVSDSAKIEQTEGFGDDNGNFNDNDNLNALLNNPKTTKLSVLIPESTPNETQQLGEMDNDDDAPIVPVYDPKTTEVSVLIPEIAPNESKTIVFEAMPRDRDAVSVKNRATATYSDEKPIH